RRKPARRSLVSDLSVALVLVMQTCPMVSIHGCTGSVPPIEIGQMQRGAAGRARMAERHQVIIIGGGPVGVGLGVELGLHGIDCVVIERRKELARIPKGQNLTPRT